VHSIAKEKIVSSMQSIDWTDVRNRARAAFVGLALGDALGAPVEFMTRNEIRVKYDVLREMVGGGWLNLKPGQVTDDTEMSLYLARSIVEGKGWSLPRGADYLVRWLKSRPCDVGNTVRRGLRAFMTKGQLETPPCSADGGNGAAMRLLPVALCCLGDETETHRYVIEQAHLTHNHPYSDVACLTLAKLVQLSLMGQSKMRLLVETRQMVEAHPVFAFNPYPGNASGYILDTVQTVFYHFFRSRDFEGCLVDTVNLGGDADTNGAIIGMLAGAYYGREGLPRRWLRALSPSLLDELESLACALVERSPLGQKFERSRSD
jgi:ADP-ribosyl-[dinitrogen reductase] hydrolase